MYFLSEAPRAIFFYSVTSSHVQMFSSNGSTYFFLTLKKQFLLELSFAVDHSGRAF
jgi:hypothetical protein